MAAAPRLSLFIIFFSHGILAYVLFSSKGQIFLQVVVGKEQNFHVSPNVACFICL